MAKARERRLKVFQTHLGFFDTVVAAPSQAAALRAWGLHQNIFADGLARIADDPQAVAAALGKGTVASMVMPGMEPNPCIDADPPANRTFPRCRRPGRRTPRRMPKRDSPARRRSAAR